MACTEGACPVVIGGWDAADTVWASSGWSIVRGWFTRENRARQALGLHLSMHTADRPAPAQTHTAFADRSFLKPCFFHVGPKKERTDAAVPHSAAAGRVLVEAAGGLLRARFSVSNVTLETVLFVPGEAISS